MESNRKSQDEKISSLTSTKLMESQDVVKHKFDLALIREQYLQARPPQLIVPLRDILHNYARGRKTMKISSPSPAHCHCHDPDKIIDQDYDGSLCRLGSGSKTEEKPFKEEKKSTTNPLSNVDLRESSSPAKTSNRKKSNLLPSPSSYAVSDETVVLDVVDGLYSSTLGYSHLSPNQQTSFHDKDITSDRHCHDRLKSFLHPPIQYRISFVKHIIKQLESQSFAQDDHERDIEGPVEQDSKNETLLETWYAGLEKLLSCNVNEVGEPKLKEPFYRLYEIKVGESSNTNERGGGGGWRKEIVKVFENESSFVADGTTGLVTWKASTEFLKWLSDEIALKNPLSHHPEKGASWILELGCGCGLLAIAVTKCMNSTLERYIATDGSLSALEQAKLNVEENFWREEDKSLKSKIYFEKVEWDNEATHESFGQLVDGMTNIYGKDKGLLLGADIIFDPEIVPDIVSLMKQFLESFSGRVILSSTIRNEATMTTFKNRLDDEGLISSTCINWDDGEITEIRSKEV